MAEELASKHCVPCRGGVTALKGKELSDLARQVPGWKVVNEHHLARTYDFPDFKSALELVNRIGAVAEQEGHHPNICFTWGKVEVTVYTHKIDGLTESAFIPAAKLGKLPGAEKKAEVATEAEILRRVACAVRLSSSARKLHFEKPDGNPRTIQT